MEFSKTIFQAWKVIENKIGHGKLNYYLQCKTNQSLTMR